MVICYGDCYYGNSCYDKTHVEAEIIAAMLTHIVMFFGCIIRFMNLGIYMSNLFQNLLIKHVN